MDSADVLHFLSEATEEFTEVVVGDDNLGSLGKFDFDGMHIGVLTFVTDETDETFTIMVAKQFDNPSV